MGLTGHIVTIYPPALTDAQWKATKTAATGDKLKTDVGGALRAAATAYGHINFDTLDLAQHNLHHPAFVVVADVQNAKTAAKSHYTVAVKPAIKALETAKTKVDLAKINPILSAPARAKANQMSPFLGNIITTLKSFNTNDYDAEITQLVRNYTHTKAQFTGAVDDALSRARKFIGKVRKTPTPAVYNAGIMTAARDLTQQLGHVDEMQKSGFDLGKHGATATNLFNQLTPRANGHANVPANATAAVVGVAIDEFADMIDEVAEWWT